MARSLASMGDSLDDLEVFLRSVPPGPIIGPLRAEVIGLLKKAWQELSGSTQTGMEAYKLDGAESLEWETPTLQFQLARHGATVLGSPREHIFRWRVDLATNEASVEEVGFRQVRPRAPDLRKHDIERIIEHVLQHVAKGWQEPSAG
jgi:hypothetical protein